MAALVCCLGIAGGCGSGASPGADSPQAAIPLPIAPRASECASAALARALPALDAGPPAGRYAYGLRGESVLAGQTREWHPLPRTMTVAITPSTRVGGLECFKLQRRFTRSLAETQTFVEAAAAVYLRRVVLEASEGEVLIDPQPPILAVSARLRSWFGTFRGRTHGRYRGRVLGRGTIEVAGQRIRAAHIALELSFAGEVTGSEHSDYWFSLHRDLPVIERVTQRRRVGLDEIRIRYRAALARREP